MIFEKHKKKTIYIFKADFSLKSKFFQAYKMQRQSMQTPSSAQQKFAKSKPIIIKHHEKEDNMANFQPVSNLVVYVKGG